MQIFHAPALEQAIAQAHSDIAADFEAGTDYALFSLNGRICPRIFRGGQSLKFWRTYTAPNVPEAGIIFSGTV